jgi:hypothetical protein
MDFQNGFLCPINQSGHQNTSAVQNLTSEATPEAAPQSPIVDCPNRSKNPDETGHELRAFEIVQNPPCARFLAIEQEIHNTIPSTFAN